MAIAKENQVTNNGQSTSPSVTFNFQPTAGNRLIAMLQCGASTVNTPPSGWSAFPLSYASTNITAIYHKVAAGTENGTSVTWAVDEDTYFSAQIFEYSGLDASPEDQTAAAYDDPQSESLTITASAQNAQASSLCIVSYLVYDDNITTPTYTSGWTHELTSTYANWQNGLVFTKITTALETPSIQVDIDNSGTGMEQQASLAVFSATPQANDFGVTIDLDQREFVKTVNPA
jgi:hypothetical protein